MAQLAKERRCRSHGDGAWRKAHWMEAILGIRIVDYRGARERRAVADSRQRDEPRRHRPRAIDHQPAGRWLCRSFLHGRSQRREPDALRRAAAADGGGLRFEHADVRSWGEGMHRAKQGSGDLFFTFGSANVGGVYAGADQVDGVGDVRGGEGFPAGVSVIRDWRRLALHQLIAVKLNHLLESLRPRDGW